MRLNRSSAPILAPMLCAALLANGCTPDWPSSNEVRDLRLLAIQAEPPDLAPGASTKLSALTPDPTAPERESMVLWFACDPIPASPGTPPCATFSTLDDATDLDLSLITDPSVGLRPLFARDGAAPWREAIYDAPPALFDELDPSDLKRNKGVLAYILAIAVQAEPFAEAPTEDELAELYRKVRDKELRSVLSIKRVRIADTGGNFNKNPGIEALVLGGSLGMLQFDGSSPLYVRQGASLALDVLPTEGSQEHFLVFDVDGGLEEHRELLSVTWFSTHGNFSEARTVVGTPVTFAMSPNAKEGATGALFAVLRDGRGGATWLVLPMIVAPRS